MQKKTKNERFDEAVQIDFIELDKALGDDLVIAHGCIYVRRCVPVWGVHKAKRFVVSYVNR